MQVCVKEKGRRARLGAVSRVELPHLAHWSISAVRMQDLLDIVVPALRHRIKRDLFIPLLKYFSSVSQLLRSFYTFSFIHVGSLFNHTHGTLNVNL